MSEVTALENQMKEHRSDADAAWSEFQKSVVQCKSMVPDHGTGEENC